MKRELTDKILSMSDYETQQLKWLEELAELSQAIAKAESVANILEEMADVYVCLDQMESLFGWEHDIVMDVAERKQLRTIKRMERKRE